MERVPRIWQIVAGLLLALVTHALAPSGASAHSDIDYTLPTDGASIGEPLTEVTVAFTEAVTLVGPGFEVLSPQGEILVPFVVTDDDQVFRLQIDPPMGGGDVGVRYEVTAQDGHVISGGFSFTVSVEAPAPTTTAAPAPTTQAPVPTTAAPAPTTGAPTTTAAPSTAAPATTQPVVDEQAEAVEAEPVAAESADVVATDDDDDGSNAVGIFLAIVIAGVLGGGIFLWLPTFN